MRKNSNLFLVICALPFLLLSFFLYRSVPDPYAHFDQDSVGYDRVAQHFVQTGQLTEPNGDVPIQPVGYHFFLGLLYKLFGRDFGVVVWVQVLIMLACLWLLFIITNRLFNREIAVAVAALSSINLGFLIYPQFLLAETLALLFLLLFFERFFLFFQTKKVTQLVQAGVILGVSVLIKPLALLFAVLLIPVMCVYRYGIKSIVLFLFCFYLPIVGYMTCNYVYHGHFALAPMNSLNMYQCFLSKVIAQVEGKPKEQVRTVQLAFRGKHAFDEEGWDEGRNLFHRYLKSHPRTFVTVWLKNVAKTVLGLYTTQLKVLLEPDLKGGECSFFKQSGTFFERMWGYISCGTDSGVLKTIGVLETMWMIVRWLLVFFGMVALVYTKYYFVLSVSGLYVFQSALVTGIDGCCRYRVMFEPMLIMLAVVGIFFLCGKLRPKN